MNLDSRNIQEMINTAKQLNENNRVAKSINETTLNEMKTTVDNSSLSNEDKDKQYILNLIDNLSNKESLTQEDINNAKAQVESLLKPLVEEMEAAINC